MRYASACMDAAPRIGPGSRGDIGLVNYAIARAIGAATGGGPPNIFTTLARHRSLFRRWLRFAGGLMPGGLLPRAESELVILRVAGNCESEYERRHHERLGAQAGLTADEIARVAEGPDADGWSERHSLLLRAADELHSTDRKLSDVTWDALRPHLSDAELIELCMLIGHYEMVAMTLNSLEVVPDAVSKRPPPKLVRAIQRRIERAPTEGLSR